MTTIKRKWGATGVTTVQRFTLDAAARANIRSQLQVKRVADQLFAALEDAGASYLSMKALAAQSKPAAARKNLRTAATCAHKLSAALDALDGNACQLIDGVTVNDNTEPAPNITDMRKQALLTALTLDQALKLADDYPQRGALPDDAKRYLARDVADALRAQEIEPTTTRDGPYEAVLGAMLEALTGSTPEDVHDLAVRGVKVVKAASSGLTEYTPD